MALSILLLLLSFSLTETMADFTTVPSSLTVGVGEEAVFMCRYPGASIIWRVNEQPIMVSDPITVTSSGEQSSDTLTITALPEYNGTEVVCVALLTNLATRSTLPVHLTIDFNSNTTATDSDEFTISPKDQTVPMDVLATFECQHNLTSILWRVNGDSVRGNSTHIPVTIVNGSNIIYTLSIMAKFEFNNSIVECEAVDLEQKKTAQLQVQGMLDLPSNLSTSICLVDCSVSWKKATSLDITKVEPDVIYVVELYQLGLCGDEGNLLLSHSNIISETRYKYREPNFPYKLLVTPRNNVEGAQNGTSRSLEVTQYISFDKTSATIERCENNVTVTLYPIPEISKLTGIIPASFSVSLQTIDNEDEYDVINEADCPCITNDTMNTITLQHQLPSQRLWIYRVFVLNCTNVTISSDDTFSTHYVQNITAEYVHHGKIEVCGDYVTDSEAKGFLVIISSLTSNEVHYNVSYRGSFRSCTTLSGLSRGSYNYSVFTVNETGFPITKSANVSKSIDVPKSDAQTEDVDGDSKITAETVDNTTCNGVFIRCTIKDDSANSCVAVVHEKNTTSPYGLLNIKVQHLIDSGDGTVSGCVENVTLGEHYIAIFAYNSSIGRKAFTLNAESPNVSSNSTLAATLISVLVGIVFNLVLAVTVVVLVILLKRIYRKPNRMNDVEGDDHTMSSNEYSLAPKSSNTMIPLTEQESSSSGSSSINNDARTPLLQRSLPPIRRVQSDGESYSTVLPPSQRIQSDEGSYSTVADTHVQSFSTQSDSEACENTNELIVYAETEVLPSGNLHLSTDDPVQYAEISNTQGVNGNLYSVIEVPQCATKGNPDDLTKVVYSDIDLNAVPRPLSAKRAVTRHPCDLSQPLLTPESVHFALLPVASKWLALGEAFPLSDKRLDDITTTESDEICLQEMVDVYMQRADLDHSWDEIVAVLKKIGEDDLADKIHKEHVSPYFVSLPNQPDTVEEYRAHSLPPFHKGDLPMEEQPPALPPKPVSTQPHPDTAQDDQKPFELTLESENKEQLIKSPTPSSSYTSHDTKDDLLDDLHGYDSKNAYESFSDSKPCENFTDAEGNLRKLQKAGADKEDKLSSVLLPWKKLMEEQAANNCELVESGLTSSSKENSSPKSVMAGVSYNIIGTSIKESVPPVTSPSQEPSECYYSIFARQLKRKPESKPWNYYLSLAIKCSKELFTLESYQEKEDHLNTAVCTSDKSVGKALSSQPASPELSQVLDYEQTKKIAKVGQRKLSTPRKESVKVDDCTESQFKGINTRSESVPSDSGVPHKKTTLEYFKLKYEWWEWLIACLTLFIFISESMKSQLLRFMTRGQIFCILILLSRFSVSFNSQFQIPEDQVQAEGANAIFLCLHENAVATAWFVNNEPYSDQFGGNVEFIRGGSRLTLPCLPGYSSVVVMCSVTVNASYPRTLNASANLLIQGPLGQVTDISRICDKNKAIIELDPPVSLNLTTVEPDIQYIVTVHRSDNTVVQSTTVTTPIFELNMTQLDPQYLHHILITPKSNVQGAILGNTSEPIPLLCTLGVEDILIQVENSVVNLRQIEGLARYATIFFNITIYNSSGSKTCKLEINEMSDKENITLIAKDCGLENYHQSFVDIVAFDAYGRFTIVTRFETATREVSITEVDNTSPHGIDNISKGLSNKIVVGIVVPVIVVTVLVAIVTLILRLKLKKKKRKYQLEEGGDNNPCVISEAVGEKNSASAAQHLPLLDQTVSHYDGTSVHSFNSDTDELTKQEHYTKSLATEKHPAQPIVTSTAFKTTLSSSPHEIPHPEHSLENNKELAQHTGQCLTNLDSMAGQTPRLSKSSHEQIESKFKYQSNIPGNDDVPNESPTGESQTKLTSESEPVNSLSPIDTPNNTTVSDAHDGKSHMTSDKKPPTSGTVVLVSKEKVHFRLKEPRKSDSTSSKVQRNIHRRRLSDGHILSNLRGSHTTKHDIVVKSDSLTSDLEQSTGNVWERKHRKSSLSRRHSTSAVDKKTTMSQCLMDFPINRFEQDLPVDLSCRADIDVEREDTDSFRDDEKDDDHEREVR